MTPRQKYVLNINTYKIELILRPKGMLATFMVLVRTPCLEIVMESMQCNRQHAGH